MSTAYHPQTDGQTERANRDIEASLRIYCGSHPEKWADHIADLEFSHNNTTHSATQQSPFALMMGYEPQAIPTLATESNLPSAEQRLKELTSRRDEARASIEMAKQRMAERITRNFTPFKLGQKVWLEAKNLNIGGDYRKLQSEREGPFPITKVLGPLVYELKLPDNWTIHPVFHASLLSPCHETDAHGPLHPQLPPDLVDGEEEYKIENIVGHKKRKIRNRDEYTIRYEVKWKGWPNSENTLLREEDLGHAQDILQAYKRQHRIQEILINAIRRL